MKNTSDTFWDLVVDWIWRIYFLVYIGVTLISLYFFFFQPSSTISIYYVILTSYHLLFFIPYLLNAACLMVDFFCIIPFFYYISKGKARTPGFWKSMFFLRILLNIFGRSFHYNMFKSYSHDNKDLTILIAITSILMLAPSFVAHYHVAFRNKHL